MRSLARHRLTRAAVSALVVTVVAAPVVGGCSNENATAGKPLHAPASFDPSLPAWIACSRLIVEGDVVRVLDAKTAGRMVTVLAVDRWIKPRSGPNLARIETADIAAEGVYKRWKRGSHLFLQVDVDPSALPSWQFDARMIARIERAVPESRSIECPYGPA